MKRGGAHKRRDTAEGPIIDALRKVGAFVIQINGNGCPDLLVYWRNRWLPMEVKSRAGIVSDKQQWYPIVRSIDDALDLFRK